jgi:catechol 2,3-dioxygenase-like lactoylglutathione lyase family enzyme
MIIGTHLLLYSRDPNADRAFFRDVLGLSHVDAGGGWLIFALPPAEIGVHPTDETQALTRAHAGHDLATATVYLLCSPLKETLDHFATKGVAHTPLQEADWGIATSIPLPGGASLGLYEPKHALAAKTIASTA